MSPLTQKGKKIRNQMRQSYGSQEKGDQVFYSSINAKRIKGAEAKRKKKGT